MMKITGFDQVEMKLKEMGQGAQELAETKWVSFTELFPEAFLSRHSKYSSVNELFENSGFKINSQDDFGKIPDDKWDEYIRSVSDFDDWQSMLSAAMEEWTAKKLGLR
jgi:hypothetical protein